MSDALNKALLKILKEHGSKEDLASGLMQDKLRAYQAKEAKDKEIAAAQQGMKRLAEANRIYDELMRVAVAEGLGATSKYTTVTTTGTTHTGFGKWPDTSEAKQEVKKASMKILDCWEKYNMALEAETPRIISDGPPGTGKTHTIQLWAAKKGKKCFSITISEDMPMSEARGHYVTKDGSFIWHDGPFVRWWRTPGAVLVVNEIDLAGGDLIGFLHGAFDDGPSASMTLPTGETVKPAGGQIVLATTNASPDDMIPAIRDRFPVRIHIDKVNPAAIAKLDKDLQQVATNAAVAEASRRISVRSFYAFQDLRAKIGPENAAQLVFVDRAQELLDAIKVGQYAGKV